MKRGFYTIMSAQFFSSLADNALFVTAVELLRTNGAPEWQRAALVPMFALFYVILAPFVGAFADALPKGRVMFISNAIKIVGCLMMLFGNHPLLSYAVVGLGLMLLAAAMRLSHRWLPAFGVLAALFYMMLLLSLLFDSKPSAALRLYHWHYIHMLNYNGFSQLVILLFPVLLLGYLWRTAMLQKK